MDQRNARRDQCPPNLRKISRKGLEPARRRTQALRQRSELAGYQREQCRAGRIGQRIPCPVLKARVAEDQIVQLVLEQDRINLVLAAEVLRIEPRKLGERALGKRANRRPSGHRDVGHQRVVAMVAELGRVDRAELQIFIDHAVAERLEAGVLAGRGRCFRRGCGRRRNGSNANR